MLLDDVAAVDNDRLAGEVARFARAQESDRCRDLVRRAREPNRRAAPRLELVGFLGAGRDPAGRHRVGGYSVAAVLDRDRPHESVECAFGRGVGC